MIVYFLRHAEAEPDANRDFDRQLTAKGLEQSDKAGKFLARYGLVPDLILSSPVVRARQTAKIAADRLGKNFTEVPWLACGMEPSTCLQELAVYGKQDTILLVGHEPDFSETLAACIGLEDSQSLHIRKSSLSAVDLPDLTPGCGQLQFLVPARLM